MSLKAFHIFFVTLSSLLSFGCGGWLLWKARAPEGTQTDLIIGLILLGLGTALILYGRYFLKKLKHIGYL